jgi:hypothetical protein
VKAACVPVTFEQDEESALSPARLQRKLTFDAQPASRDPLFSQMLGLSTTVAL